MPQEATPLSKEVMDNLRIAIVPSGSNALSVAILAAGTVKDLTYSLTPDGWAFPRAETEIPDPRLTLKNEGSRPGRVKDGPIVLKYVFGDAGDVAKNALTQGTSYTLTYRDSIANATAWTIGQKVDTIVVVAGAQRKLPPAQDGLQLLIEQTLYVAAGGFKTDQLLVA